MEARQNKVAADITAGSLKGAQYMSMVCDNNGKVNGTYLSFDAKEFFDFLNSVKKTNFIHICHWTGESKKCRDIFFPIITDEGICYTFNMLDRDDLFREKVAHYANFMKRPMKENLTWSLDDGYQNNDINTYPMRAKLPGVKNGLEVVMVVGKHDLDPICKNSLQGFRVILHTSMRFPRPSSQYFRVPLDESVMGAIQPVKMTTSETVQAYDVAKRNCYFPGEVYLRYFKIYTQLNCQLECLANLTERMCNCVNFFMPRENTTDICGTTKKTCMILAERYFQLRELTDELDELYSKRNTNRTFNTTKNNCKCLPICSDLTYSVETSQAKWNWQDLYTTMNPKQKSRKWAHMSKLTLYFKTSQFVTSRKHELYGLTDFLSNFGGLLGLFTGFSVLSIMELVYFLTIRLCCNVRLYGKWYGPDY